MLRAGAFYTLLELTLTNKTYYLHKTCYRLNMFYFTSDTQNRTAGDEQDVNFYWNEQIVLEIKYSVWYNIDTERKAMTRSLVRRKSSRRQTSPRRCTEISADVSDERSNMSWVCFDKCRKVARLQSLQGEDVPFAGCSCAVFRLFCFGGTKCEKETSSKLSTPVPVLWQPFGFEKR